MFTITKPKNGILKWENTKAVIQKGYIARKYISKTHSSILEQTSCILEYRKVETYLPTFAD